MIFQEIYTETLTHHMMIYISLVVKVMRYIHTDIKKIIKKTVWLVAYIPSKIRGRRIKAELDKMNFEYTNYSESDLEVEFHFKAKDIGIIAEKLEAKTSGANISPFSKRNLPKAKNVNIALEKIEEYKAIISKVQKEDLLIIHRITNTFLVEILNKRYKNIDKTFDYRVDMKKQCMSRLIKEYIDKMGMWDEYIKYLDDGITKFYKEKK